MSEFSDSSETSGGNKKSKRIDALQEVFGNNLQGVDIFFESEFDINDVNWKEILDDIDILNPSLFDLMSIMPLLVSMLYDYIDEDPDEEEEK